MIFKYNIKNIYKIMEHIVFFLFLLYIPQSFCKKYYNYTLYRGIPINEHHLEFYRNLSEKYDVSFWRDPGLLNKPIEFTVSPEDNPDLILDATKFGLYLTTIIEDVQSAFDNQTVKTYIRRRTESFDWVNYFKIDDIYNWMRDLLKNNPDRMKLTNLGKTVEGRDILAVSINLEDKGAKMRSVPKTTVIMEGGIHAREWISVSFVTYFLNEILHAPESENKELKKIAYLYDWHFVPVLNPDGYEYTHTKDRLWRKNRHDGKNGVDINRNFDYEFGKEGISLTKSSDIYCGDKAFSERESKAISDFVRSKSSTLEYYFGFHAYGQYIIIPYATSVKHVDNFDEIKSLAKFAAKRVKSKYGTKYSIGTAFDTVGYKTSGISGDWVKLTFKTRVVATFELPDEGRYGFALPPHRILPTCKETLDLMLSFLQPRDGDWRGLNMNAIDSEGHIRTVLDHVVIVFNMLLFIIVRFDYFWIFI